LQQGSVKMQQTAAIGRRSFRKNSNMLALAKNGGDLLVDDPGVPAAAPAQEDSVVPGCQPADDRPVTHLLLRHESRWHDRIDHENVDP